MLWPLKNFFFHKNKNKIILNNETYDKDIMAMRKLFTGFDDIYLHLHAL